MHIPTYDQFIEPLLRYLATQPEARSASQAASAVADRCGLSAEAKNQLLPSGNQAVYRNRMGWAHDRLKRAGYSQSIKRGWWQITPAGQDFLRQYPDEIPAQEIERLALLGAPNSPASSTATSAEQASHTLHQSPDERLASALQELRAAAERDLLETLAQVSPSFFETIVLDLLHRMGYGNSRADLQRVGGSGDGGIDGIIPLDKLGLEKVYVQAKRWKGNVGRPEVQGFFGALAGHKARKGVFITTSAYTEQALAYAQSVDGLVLIDGPRLASLMVDHEVGTSARLVKIPKIDSDYFEGEVL